MSRLARCTANPLLWRRFVNSYQSSCGFHSQEKSAEKPKRYPTAKYLAEKNLEKFEAGATVHGFLVEDVERIDVFDLIALKLTHLRTGAQYLHLARDDSNNVFAIGFRTTPSDSTGVPHILEHMALCGSAKYPCRDPFFKMLRRSLATFMNAMTGFDYTVYPFSTVNEKDFGNLRSVYLDAVFRPNLRELDFKQEGWRLEHQNPDDRNSPIVLKGVVFNEMKGVFSENENLLQYRFFNDILPSHTYGVCSGGNPLVIPTLNYEDLLNFHKTYYHPSNSRFYSYGSLALEEHLEYINENYLATTAEKLDCSMSKVPGEKRWREPRYSQIECGPNPLNPEASRCGSIAIGYLCNDITEIQESLDLSIVADLLLGGPKSPFYGALIESALGTSFGPLTGYHAFTKDVPFALSLTGVRPETFRQVEDVFERTMAKIVEDGFTQQQIRAAVHSVELRMKHIPRNFGLQLLYGLNSRWNHDADVIRSLKVNELLDTFEGVLKRNPSYIQDLLEKYFLNNRHKLVATMLPKEEYPAAVMRAEQELLERKLRGLSAEELNKIYLDGQVLRAEQERQENPDVLPILEIRDVEPTPTGRPGIRANLAAVPVSLYRTSTNGLCYYRSLIDTSQIPDDLKDLIPLFGNAVTQMGTKNYDYRRFTEMAQLKTDGLEFSPHVSTDKTDLLKYEEAILISSRCLDRNLAEMWALWSELFNNVTLNDANRFETIVGSYTADLVEGIADAGHSYAMQSAASLVSPSYSLKERFSGLSHIRRMKSLAQERDFTSTLAKIRDIARRVLNKGRMRSSINAAQDHEELFDSVRQFHETLKPGPEPPTATARPDRPSPGKRIAAIHHVFPYSVNYASKAVLTVPYSHPEYPALRLLAPLISSIYLHPEIREKGGAYGSGAKLSPSGVFFFYSYRDPNSSRTFDTFDKSYDFLRKYTLSDSDLHQAKLQVLQQFSAPITPSNHGMEEFLYGLTDEMRARLIENVKSATKDCLMQVAQKYLQPADANQRVGRAFIGPANPEFLEKRPESWTIERGE